MGEVLQNAIQQDCKRMKVAIEMQHLLILNFMPIAATPIEVLIKARLQRLCVVIHRSAKQGAGLWDPS